MRRNRGSRRKRMGRGWGTQRREGEVEEEEASLLQEVRLSGETEVIRGVFGFLSDDISSFLSQHSQSYIVPSTIRSAQELN